MFNTSCRIPRVLLTEIPTSDAVWSSDFLLSLLTTSRIRTFASFIDVDEDHCAQPPTLASGMDAFMLGMHLRFFRCFSPYACCYMLMSPLVIPAAKHKICYSLFSYKHFHLWRDLTQTRKETIAPMPSEVTKWRKHIRDEVTSVPTYEIEISLLQHFI